MKNLEKSWCIQIEVTNICPFSCAYCSRYNRHIRKDQRFFMELDTFRKAVKSLEGFDGLIGLIGGEPTIHPQFKELCFILKYEFNIRSNKVALWTSGGIGFEKHRELINITFGHLAYNKHNEEQQKVCLHQPLTIAIDDVVEDEKYKKELIDNCWVQRTWCPSIGPKGAFFCEIAHALDMILDGPGGWEIEKDWWQKEPKDFQEQVKRYCGYCGMPVPIKRELLSIGKEKISPGLLKLFEEHNLPNLESTTLFDRKLTIEEMEETKKTWDPGNYRQDLHPDMKDGWERRKG